VGKRLSCSASIRSRTCCNDRALLPLLALPDLHGTVELQLFAARHATASARVRVSADQRANLPIADLPAQAAADSECRIMTRRAVTFLHRLQLTWELNRSLARRKAARPARQEAAQRAVSTQIKRRAAKCREVFS
jgi:hypothetical protein